ncbi:precorrin-4 C(11)-methyltransferase [Zongyangia hominis]|uniref:Precorrin-4 C(11)-methyltransferase n=1 Tax=Zongyangia hominis TaxID=2763677 RepID=A0A926EC82_9FIRM|nr:precorrin-4 C(11)-methyltransferase [Zongyangia hominis]MBC8569291.1 precorrin-4 C(11)-methyltransferase [Zongyangia hominis]
MVHFVGAGPGAVDLITVRGMRLLSQADVIIYAGSLVNPQLLSYAKKGCEIHNSAAMTLEETFAVMQEAEREGKTTVRLHTGDPSLYGAIREQIELLEEAGISSDVTPGVSSFCAAASALQAEYTLPGISQSVIITRLAGRTPVPEREKIESLSAHGATMVIFLSAGMLPELRRRLLEGGCREDTPAAIVYKASWPEEQVVRGRVGDLPEMARRHGIERTALILVGEFLDGKRERSKLYDPAFGHGYREAKQ